MRIRGSLVDHVLLAGGKQRLTIETPDDFRGEYDRLHGKEISAEIKVYRKPRSLDANAYFHVLVNEIAKVLQSSDDEVKKQLVIRYGTIERDDDGGPYGIMLPAKADPDRVYPYTRRYKTVEQNGKMFHCYLLLKHTRFMDSAEMSHLIDGAVSEAKQLGVETMTPDELASLKGLEPPDNQK